MAYAGDYNFKPGLWESTTNMEIKGVPEQMAAMMKMPSHTEKSCVKENDLIFKTDSECTYERNRVNKNKMKITISCNTPQGITKGQGEISFNGKTSSGWFEMNVPNGPVGPMTMKSTFNSKYISACK
jgi:hypothetical protein